MPTSASPATTPAGQDSRRRMTMSNGYQAPDTIAVCDDDEGDKAREIAYRIERFGNRTYRREDLMGKKVWLITGAGRGMGVDFVRAALAAGHAVVASGRDAKRVSNALGQSNDLLAVKLEVTKQADAGAAA